MEAIEGPILFIIKQQQLMFFPNNNTPVLSRDRTPQTFIGVHFLKSVSSNMQLGAHLANSSIRLVQRPRADVPGGPRDPETSLAAVFQSSRKQGRN